MMSNVLNDAANGDQWWLEAVAGREYSTFPTTSPQRRTRRTGADLSMRCGPASPRVPIRDEATAKEKGINKGMLQAKIDEMAGQSLIRAHIKEAAHEVRYPATTWARRLRGSPSTARTQTIPALMAEVLAEVFQSARIAKVKAKIASPKATGNYAPARTDQTALGPPCFAPCLVGACRWASPGVVGSRRGLCWC